MTQFHSGSRLRVAMVQLALSLDGLSKKREFPAASERTYSRWCKSGIPAHALEQVAQSFGVPTWVFTEEDIDEDDFRLILSDPKQIDLIKQRLDKALREQVLAKDRASSNSKLLQPSEERDTVLDFFSSESRIVQRSYTNADDAGVISEAVDGLKGERIHLDQGLYVTRKVEKELWERLVISESVTVPLVLFGHGGMGKTSLLWNFYNQFMNLSNWLPLFVKASDLYENELSKAEPLFWKELKELITKRIEAKVQVVVLIDTVDLLMHQQQDRDYLLSQVQLLLQLGCRVLLTCRPQESQLLSPLKPERVSLGFFQPEEFEQAVHKYVDRFYRHASVHTRLERLEHIRGAVAQGRPLQEICLNPLTFRMLFTLYQPEQVPLEINVTELYRQYWDRKVAQDFRDGTLLSDRPQGADLSFFAGAVAVTMLMLGRLELEATCLRNHLQSYLKVGESLELLVARGVLVHSGQNPRFYKFFHQTFFEHAAARGLLNSRSIDGLSFLYKRFQDFPEDLFIAPILEQTLLLEEFSSSGSGVANDILIELLESSHHISKISGIYVNAHRFDVPVEIQDIIHALLDKEASTLIIRYLETAPNLRIHRRSELFRNLSLIWKRQRWQEQSHIFALLERMAPQQGESVEQWMVENRVVEMILETDKSFLAELPLFEVLRVLIFYRPTFSTKVLALLYDKTAQKFNSREFQGKIVDIIYETSLRKKDSTIIDAFEERLHYEIDEKSKDLLPFRKAWGRLFFTRWKFQKKSIEELLKNEPDGEGNDHLNWLNGIAEFLFSGTIADVETAYHHFLNRIQYKQSQFTQWQWCEVVWVRLLSGEGFCENKPENRIVDWIQNRMIEDFIDWHEKMDHGDQLFSAQEMALLVTHFSKSFSKVIWKPIFVKRVSSSAFFKSAKVWSQYPDTCGCFLANAFLSGVNSAKTMVQEMVDSPEKVEFKTGNGFLSFFLENWQEYRSLLPTLFLVAVKFGMTEAVERWVEEKEISQRLSCYANELQQFRDRLIKSRSKHEYIDGLKIWTLLIQKKLIAPLSLESLWNRLSATKEIKYQVEFIQILQAATLNGDYPFNEVFEKLEEFSFQLEKELPTSKRLYSLVLETMLHISSETKEDLTPSQIEQVFQAGFCPPFDAHRFGMLHSFLLRLVRAEHPSAGALLMRLIQSGMFSDLSRRLKKDMPLKFHLVFQLYFKRLNLDQLREFLSVIDSIDSVAAKLLLKALFACNFSPLMDELAAIHQSPKISHEVKEVICRHLSAKDRTKEGRGWSELSQVFR